MWKQGTVCGLLLPVSTCVCAWGCGVWLCVRACLCGWSTLRVNLAGPAHNASFVDLRFFLVYAMEGASGKVPDA